MPGGDVFLGGTLRLFTSASKEILALFLYFQAETYS
jgi:hypothetical protein